MFDLLCTASRPSPPPPNEREREKKNPKTLINGRLLHLIWIGQCHCENRQYFVMHTRLYVFCVLLMFIDLYILYLCDLLTTHAKIQRKSYNCSAKPADNHRSYNCSTKLADNHRSYNCSTKLADNHRSYNCSTKPADNHKSYNCSTKPADNNCSTKHANNHRTYNCSKSLLIITAQQSLLIITNLTTAQQSLLIKSQI